MAKYRQKNMKKIGDRRFTHSEIFLICEILEQTNGCTKTNKNMAERLNYRTGHIVNMLSSLRKRGFIENKQINGKRHIFFHINPIKYTPISGHIYFLKGVDTSFVKIGQAKDLHKRVKEINLTVPFLVELIHSIASDDINKNERMFHRKFKNKRSKGEWFNLTDVDIAYIKTIKEIK